MNSYTRKILCLKAMKSCVSMHFLRSKISDLYCYFEKLTNCDCFRKNWWLCSKFISFVGFIYFRLLHRIPDYEFSNPPRPIYCLRGLPNRRWPSIFHSFNCSVNNWNFTGVLFLKLLYHTSCLRLFSKYIMLRSIARTYIYGCT